MYTNLVNKSDFVTLFECIVNSDCTNTLYHNQKLGVRLCPMYVPIMYVPISTVVVSKQ